MCCAKEVAVGSIGVSPPHLVELIAGQSPRGRGAEVPIKDIKVTIDDIIEDIIEDIIKILLKILLEIS